MLVPRARERSVHLRALGSLAVGLAEDLRDDEGEHVGRAACAVDARRVDGEVESPAPVLAAQLHLDQPVEGVDLVRGIVVDRPQPLEGRRGLVQTADVQREVGELDEGKRILGLRFRHRGDGIQSLGLPSGAAVDGRDRPERVEVPRLTLERLAEQSRGLVLVPRAEGEVAEVDQRRRVVRIGLDDALERFPRSLEIALFETRPCFFERHSASASQV